MVARIKTRGPAPVHLWDPPFCGDMDMVITRDGSWVHEGRPIRRPAMVALFASILKLESDQQYYLVTPVEKVRIQVQDCPFVVQQMEHSGEGPQRTISFTTNIGETVVLDADHDLEVETDAASAEPHPTLHIRSGLRALLARPVFYRLVELAEERETSGRRQLGVWSSGRFFPLGDV